MASFDIVSRTDMAEVTNAINNLNREISQRYDFKTSHSSVEYSDAQIKIEADDELKLKQIHEMLVTHFTRRKLDAGVLDYKVVEKAAGQTVRQLIEIRQGINKELAKKIIAEIKKSKIKVQSAIQGDEIRINGKKRDDLQAVIQLVKAKNFGMALQYVNFRD